MDEFFQSVSRSFAENRAHSDLVVPVLLALVALQLFLHLRAGRRQQRERKGTLELFAARHSLSAEELQWALELAAQVQADPLALLANLDVFERSTAHLLAGPVGQPDHLANHVRLLRHALGYDRLPAHFPLLSTRELPRGTAVEVAGHGAAISRTDERSFTVDLVQPAGPAASPAGSAVAIDLVHARDARYALRCKLLEQRSGQRGCGGRLLLAHDEAPVRVQHREYARVQTSGVVRLRPVPPESGGVPEHEGVQPLPSALDLVDASGGGLQVASGGAVQVGALLYVSFQLGKAAFEDLPAVVLSGEPAAAGGYRSRLEFGDLDEETREKLVSAVQRVSLAQRAAVQAGPAA
jgi:c-di-GMP-binding flagellar brake protein YcgR